MASRRLRWLSMVFDKVLLLTCYVAGGILIIMMLCITYEVVMRYFFNAPTTWVTDFAGYMQYVLILLGGAWVLKIDGHPRIDIIVSRTSSKTNAIVRIATSSLAAIACCIFFWKGLEAALNASRRGDFLYRTVEVPLAPLYAVIPLSFLLIFIEFVRQIHDRWRSLKDSKLRNQGSQ